jgi:hypothetical protein
LEEHIFLCLREKDFREKWLFVSQAKITVSRLTSIPSSAIVTGAEKCPGYK